MKNILIGEDKAINCLKRDGKYVLQVFPGYDLDITNLSDELTGKLNSVQDIGEDLVFYFNIHYIVDMNIDTYKYGEDRDGNNGVNRVDLSVKSIGVLATELMVNAQSSKDKFNMQIDLGELSVDNSALISDYIQELYNSNKLSLDID